METCESRSETLGTVARIRKREKQTGGRFILQAAMRDEEQR